VPPVDGDHGNEGDEEERKRYAKDSNRALHGAGNLLWMRGIPVKPDPQITQMDPDLRRRTRIEAGCNGERSRVGQQNEIFPLPTDAHDATQPEGAVEDHNRAGRLKAGQPLRRCFS
jgi:hypothetical protein